MYKKLKKLLYNVSCLDNSFLTAQYIKEIQKTVARKNLNFSVWTTLQ